MRGRLPKYFVLEEWLERYSRAIELEPARLVGRWAEACWPIVAADEGQDVLTRFREVRLDVGCGKGAYLAGCAAKEPDVLFVGLDFEPPYCAYTARAICDAGLKNALVCAGSGENVVRWFAPGEVSRIHVNFPTPFPRKRDAQFRLVSLERLMDYRRVLAPGGELRLRTDNQPLRDFCLGQLELAGYEVLETSEDDRAAHPEEPVTYYEERLVAMGAKVLSVRATPGPAPEVGPDGLPQQTKPISLVEYLPADLDDLAYVPYGMEWTVETIRRSKRYRTGAKAGKGDA